MSSQAPVKTSRGRTGAALRPSWRALQQQLPQAPGQSVTDLGSGKPLAASDLARFESSLGHDFSSVRVHTDGNAAASAGALAAKAYALGDDIVFGDGRYQPETAQGRELLAHELAHVAQQQRGGGAAAQAEPRARAAARTAAAGGSVSPQALGGADPGVHCDPEDDKKPEGGGVPPSVLPPMPNFTLSTLPPLDYLKMQGIAGAHGQRFSMRDGDDMAAEWRRSAAMLKLFGLDRGLHLGPLSWTGDELLNLGLSKQYQDRLSREEPNSRDRLDKDWSQAHPGGGLSIPPITLFEKKF